MTRNSSRKVNSRSLSNLNPKARYLGKVKRTFSLRPETIVWLKKGGNASGKIDYLVESIIQKRLVWANDLERDC
jgi:hypothetical protein